MSGFDLHPEELLDRVRRGRASVAERDQVRAHLRSCEACSFEHALLAESARDATPSAGDGERARRIAQAAVASLEAAGARAALGARAARAGATRASGGKAPRRVAALLAVAIVSSLATAAAAAVMTQPAWLMRILPAAIGGEPETAREEPAARRARKKPVRMATALKPEAAVRSALAGLKRHGLPDREDWKGALTNAEPGEPVLVQRLDEIDSYYFIVPYERSRRGVTAAVAVDARFGSYRQAIALPPGGSSILTGLTSNEVISETVGRTLQLEGRNGRFTVRKEAYSLYPTLVWRPCLESLSPFVPFHMLTVGSHQIYVRIDKRIFTSLHINTPGI